MKITEIPYAGLRSIQLTIGQVELIISQEVGPRILSARFQGGENLFFVDPQAASAPRDCWQPFGGHRFWHAPEHPVRTYQPDNTAVKIDQNGETIHFKAGKEGTTGLERTLSINTSKEQIRVEHTLTNHNLFAVEAAPWAITVMRSGTIGLIPLPEKSNHGATLLPAGSLNLWGYTNLNDPRLSFSEGFVSVEQQNLPTPCKVGVSSPAAPVIGAWHSGVLFTKQSSLPPPGAVCPDQNSLLEIFTNHEMLEIETLGTLAPIPAGGSSVHTEHWRFSSCPTLPTNDQARNPYFFLR